MVCGYNDYVKYRVNFRPCLQSWGCTRWSYSCCTRRSGWWHQIWRQPQLNWQIADWEPSHCVYPFQNQAYWILLAFATNVLYRTLFTSTKFDSLKKRTGLYPVCPIILQCHLLLSSYENSLVLMIFLSEYTLNIWNIPVAQLFTSRS